MKNKFRFIKSIEEKKPNKLYRFHQICMFIDPKTSKYNIRTIIFDDDYNFVKILDKQYNAYQCKLLMESSKSTEYKTYATFDLNLIDYPNNDDLLKVQSKLL